ncbi:NPC intracellular cholesterol transporter 1-like [Littorina saxatilis]|uniref:Niemann-Pick C1 N-terminal domain-containing protein n=1 Tax=Littorina saxatilis TaxID=31220 RepID=A0AAN9AQM2_9CAEN
MECFHTWRILVCFVCFTWTVSLGDSGQCVWYGQCGFDPATKKPVNCAYNGPAKPLQTPHAVSLLKQYCPDLYQGDGTRTCCSDEQLKTLVDNIAVPVQLLGHCPSCLHNFLNIYCYMTCAPDHSQFVTVDRTTPYVDPKTGQKDLQVNEVNYAVTDDFAVGMFNSCATVRLPIWPSAKEPAIGILCGHSADECTPKNWLDYMGNTGNQQTPFQINFNITDKPYINRAGHLVTPQNAPTLPCTPTHTQGALPCTCGQPTKRPQFDKHFPPIYRTEQLIVRRTGHHPKIEHQDPPPAISTTTFSPIFDKDFLHQVLDLQDKVYALRAPYDNHNDNTVSLTDICFRLHHTDCTILSVLNYFQNNGTRIDRVVRDQPFGFFTLADYLDHLKYCTWVPESKIDTTALHESCLGTDGGPTYPWTAFQGFDGYNYQNATALVITFVVNYDNNNDAEKAKVQKWETTANEFVKNYALHQPNMTLSFSSETRHRGDKPSLTLIG